MSTITAGFDGTNNITITGTSLIPLSEFNKLASPPMPNMPGTASEKFVVEQQTINFLDTVKDGGGSRPFMINLNQLEMYGKHVPLSHLGGISSALTNLEEATFEHATIKPYFYDRSWTKGQKKNNKLNPPLPFKNIFYDVGLAPESYIVKPFDIINTFGKYMDPSKAGDSSTKYWPPKDKTLVFDASFMELFGFQNSSISATKKQENKKWNYNLKADGLDYSWDGMMTDPNSNLFAGNASKNTILKQSGQRELKKSLLMLKEWGDKFQVLTAFVWSSLNKDTYAVVTNDKVVALLCTILKLNCIQYVEKQVKGEPKKYTIKVYESSMTPNTDAAKRYNSTRKEIIAHNKDYIKLIRQLSNNPTEPIEFPSHGVWKDLPKSFYEAVLVDLENINNNMFTNNPPKPENETESADVIEGDIKNMRSEFLFIHFIRKIAGQMKMLRMKNYTSDIRSKPKLAAEFNIPNDGLQNSFYTIGLRAANQSAARGGSSDGSPETRRRMPGVRTAEERKKASQLKRATAVSQVRAQKLQEKRDAPSWDDTDFYSEPIYEWQEIPNKVQQGPLVETTMKKVDINELLRENIKKALARTDVPRVYRTMFDTVYSLVLHWSYVNSGVPLEEDDLYQLISDPANGIFQNLTTKEEIDQQLQQLQQLQQPSAVMVKAVSEDRKKRRDEDQPAPPGEGPEKVRKMSPEAESRLRATRKRARTVGGRSTRKNRKIKNIKKRTRRKKRSGRKRKKKRTLRKKH
jgi:hypothetical protein